MGPRWGHGRDQGTGGSNESQLQHLQLGGASAAPQHSHSIPKCKEEKEETFALLHIFCIPKCLHSICILCLHSFFAFFAFFFCLGRSEGPPRAPSLDTLKDFGYVLSIYNCLILFICVLNIYLTISYYFFIVFRLRQCMAPASSTGPTLRMCCAMLRAVKLAASDASDASDVSACSPW